jgi:two-component system response regulator YesN
MFKIFLVEDEVNIRENIRNTIDWESANFEYLGDAPDGELALKAIMKLRPDIVITDIKMPFVDGLELSKLLRNEFPTIKIIILSGYDDFDYAQKALRLGVVEYLLKPVSPIQLIQAVNRVAIELRQNLFNQDISTASQKAAYRKNRNDFLKQLLSGTIIPSEIFARVTELSLPFRDNYFLVASIKIHGIHPGLAAEMKMLKELDEIANSCHGVVVEQDKGKTAVIFQGNSEELIKETAFTALSEYSKFCREELEVSIFTGIGAPTERLHELVISQRESDIACNYAIFTKRKSVFFSEVQKEEKAPCLLLAENLQRTTELFQKGELSEIAAYAAEIRRAAAGIGGDMGLQYAYIDILMTAGRFLKSICVDPESVMPELGRLREDVFSLTDSGQFEKRIAGICERMISYRKKHLAGRHHELLRKAKAYIDENYSDPDLSLITVAMHVYLSPTHFSAIFSREAGETFSDYLSRIRLDKAMRLLKTTSMSASEISKLVGYRDPQYFSRVFKRSSGVSIRIFRAGDKM